MTWEILRLHSPDLPEAPFHALMLGFVLRAFLDSVEFISLTQQSKRRIQPEKGRLRRVWVLCGFELMVGSSGFRLLVLGFTMSECQGGLLVGCPST